MAARRPDASRRPSDHARELGIDTSYDLAARRNGRCEALQVLYCDDQMEAKLSAIQFQSKLAEQETGVLTLHAAFGFLEWYEDDGRNITLLAPLLVLPVYPANAHSVDLMRKSQGSMAAGRPSNR